MRSHDLAGPDGLSMAPLDMGHDVVDIDPAEPCGPNLEFDGEFNALERAAQGKPEQQLGDTLIPAEAPEWKLVEAQAAALLERTRDLRVLSLLAVARLNLAGIPGFASVLATIRQLLEERWDAVHPQLDPEDDLDPTLRSNALLRLAEPGRVLRVLRDLPLAASPRTGRVSWRDISVVLGMTEPEPDRPKLTEAGVRAAFAEAEPTALETLRDAVASAVRDSAAIPAAFDQRSGHGTGPEFGELQKLLREIHRAMERFAAAKAGEPADAAEAETEQAPAPGQEAAAPRAGGMTATSLTAISNRADAVHLLELVRAYYERYEPSSPLPLLIDRARRLADKDFLDILRDLAPDGLGQAQHIAGPKE